MRAILILALLLGQQTKSDPEQRLTASFVEVANDAVDAIERMSLMHLEPRVSYAAAKLEAIKYEQKAGRIRKTKADTHVWAQLGIYSTQVNLCQSYYNSSVPDMTGLKACLEKEEEVRKTIYELLDRR